MPTSRPGPTAPDHRRSTAFPWPKCQLSADSRRRTQLRKFASRASRYKWNDTWNRRVCSYRGIGEKISRLLIGEFPGVSALSIKLWFRSGAALSIEMFRIFEAGRVRVPASCTRYCDSTFIRIPCFIFDCTEGRRTRILVFPLWHRPILCSRPLFQNIPPEFRESYPAASLFTEQTSYRIIPFHPLDTDSAYHRVVWKSADDPGTPPYRFGKSIVLLLILFSSLQCVERSVEAM